MTFVLFHTGNDKKYATSKWADALKYLEHSDFAQFLVEGLEKSPDTIHVCVSADAENIYSAPKPEDKGGASGGYIVWNPESALAVVNQKKWFFKNQMITPQLALLHEMGHAYQYLSETEGYREAKAQGQTLERLEQNVVAVIEHTVANELKTGAKVKEGKRWSYNDIQQLSKDEMEEAQRQNGRSVNIIDRMRRNLLGDVIQRV